MPAAQMMDVPCSQVYKGCCNFFPEFCPIKRHPWLTNLASLFMEPPMAGQTILELLANPLPMGNALIIVIFDPVATVPIVLLEIRVANDYRIAWVTIDID